MSDLIVENNLKEVIYSILFVAGDGVELVDIAEKLEIDVKEVKKAVDALEKELNGNKGVHLIKYRTKVQLSSNPLYANYISAVLNPIRERALTNATLETLAIVAYKQPITRLEIEEVRGVTNSDYTIQALLEHNLIEVIGKKDAIGHPLLFGTTEEFLKRFDLSDITDLPDHDELLERIKTLYEETSDSLYNDFELPEETPNLQDEGMMEEKSASCEEEISQPESEDDFELPVEDIPDFLKDEDVEII